MNIDIEVLYEQYLNSDEYAKVIKGHTKLKNDLEKFKSTFKFNELHLLTKEKYAIGEKSFINWIQWRLVEHGSIVRGAQDKFGIYYGPLGEDETHDWRINKIWINDMNDTDISMSQLAENIQKLVTNYNNFDIYKDIKIAETIKLKILSIYYPNDFLPMYSPKYIKQLLDIVGKEYNDNECGYQLNKKLLNYKESNTLFKNIDKYIFSTFLNYLLNWYYVNKKDKLKV